MKETVHATGLQATPHPPVIVWFRFISIGDKYKTKKFKITIYNFIPSNYFQEYTKKLIYLNIYQYK